MKRQCNKLLREPSELYENAIYWTKKLEEKISLVNCPLVNFIGEKEFNSIHYRFKSLFNASPMRLFDIDNNNGDSGGNNNNKNNELKKKMKKVDKACDANQKLFDSHRDFDIRYVCVSFVCVPAILILSHLLFFCSLRSLCVCIFFCIINCV